MSNQKHRILLVDDEPDVLEFLGYNLREEGYQVHTCSNGEDAIVKAEEILPHLIILDVMMPGLGGLEVLKRIKAQKPQIHVILLTGRGSTKEGIEGMQRGAFDYLMKPINIEELIKKMQEAIKSQP